MEKNGSSNNNVFPDSVLVYSTKRVAVSKPPSFKRKERKKLVHSNTIIAAGVVVVNHIAQLFVVLLRQYFLYYFNIAERAQSVAISSSSSKSITYHPAVFISLILVLILSVRSYYVFSTILLLYSVIWIAYYIHAIKTLEKVAALTTNVHEVIFPEFQQLVKSSISRIKVAEVVYRGYKLSPYLPPISRIEQNSNTSLSPMQCLTLRKKLFSMLHALNELLNNDDECCHDANSPLILNSIESQLEAVCKKLNDRIIKLDSWKAVCRENILLMELDSNLKCHIRTLQLIDKPRVVKKSLTKQKSVNTEIQNLRLQLESITAMLLAIETKDDADDDNDSNSLHYKVLEKLLSEASALIKEPPTKPSPKKVQQLPTKSVGTPPSPKIPKVPSVVEEPGVTNVYTAIAFKDKEEKKNLKHYQNPTVLAEKSVNIVSELQSVLSRRPVEKIKEHPMIMNPLSSEVQEEAEEESPPINTYHQLPISSSNDINSQLQSLFKNKN